MDCDGCSFICGELIDPSSLEALACREALSLALDLSLTHVIIASDCQEVIINIKKWIGGLYAPIIKEINTTSSHLLDCSFIFEGRDTNQESLSLAKHTLGLPLGCHLWLLNPPDINCIPMYLDLN